MSHLWNLPQRHRIGPHVVYITLRIDGSASHDLQTVSVWQRAAGNGSAWCCLFFSFVCGAFRANTSLLHTHINTPFPSQFFVWLFLFCFCMSGFHHPSMMLLRLEKQGDARRKPERKRVFFGGYFSTLTWMYIYSLRVYLSLRWPTRIVFYTVCDNHWAHAILQCCWHDVKSTLDLTLPDVVARAAFVHHWAKNLALYCDVTLDYMLRFMKCHCV